MRTLIYKRTHTGDPDAAGTFGCRDCMRSVRGWAYEAVIGVGGSGHEARRAGIAERLTWIGIGPQKTYQVVPRKPLVAFDHFRPLHGERRGRPRRRGARVAAGGEIPATERVELLR